MFVAVSSPLAAHEAPAFVAKHHNTPEDKRAIERVLATYTKSVTDGNEAAFTALLLNVEVPFSSTRELVTGKADPGHTQTHNYEQFRQAVFASGKHYEQYFYNEKIEQDGELAQVSVDFVTTEAGTHKGGFGWKTLQLLKMQGEWKIASEFYTVYTLPDQD
jgi:hypothetical protein